MKEKAIDIKKVNLYSIPFILIGVPISIIVYKLCHGTGYRETIYQNPSLLAYFVLLIPILIVLHELIHGLFFALYSKSKFRKISFGIMWKHLAPYCHCEEAIKAKHYGVALLMPTILLGFAPFFIGFIIGNFFAVFVGIMMIMAGMGDFMAFALLLKVPGDTLVIDHPNKVGFYYEDKQNT